MPTIESTTYELYKGTTISPANLVEGFPKTHNNTAQEQTALSVNLGAAPGATGELYPGTTYGVRAYCTAEADSPWYPSTGTGLVPFTTQISIEWATSASAHGCTFVENASHQFELHLPAFQENSQGGNTADEAGCNYNSTDTTPAKVWVYIGKTNVLANAVKIQYSRQEFFQGGVTITNANLTSAGAQWGFDENTQFYVWVGVTDNSSSDGTTANDTRLFVNSSYASLQTAIATPVVTIGQISSTYNSVTVSNVSATSSETISSGYIEISTSNSFAAGQTSRINLSNPIPSTFTITDGDTDYQGGTISIQPSTPYYVRIMVATTTYPATSSNVANTTTPAAVTGTIYISGITNISPSGATVNIGYDQQP